MGSSQMVSEYTRKLAEAIISVAECCNKIDDVSIEESIGLMPIKSKIGIYFIPDITFVMVNSQVFILQLCDSESFNQKEILGDFFSALLSREVKKLYFIVRPEREIDIKLVCKTIRSVLKDKLKLSKGKLQDYVVYSIKNRNIEFIIKQMETIAIKEKWGLESNN
jgi:hypothetical protein